MPKKRSKKRSRAKKARRSTTGSLGRGFITNTAIRRAGVEVKTIDLSATIIGHQDWDGTGGKDCALLNGMAQGTDYTQHVGRVFNMKSLLFRASIYATHLTYDHARQADTTTSSYPNQIGWRVLVVYDKQANGVLPTQGNILNAGSAARIKWLQPNNLDNRDRFKVILDKKGTWDAYSNNHISFEKYIKLKGREVVTQGTTNTIGSIATGSIVLFFITSEEPSGSANKLDMDFISRIRVIDA
jgi:hypothetical protein